MICRTYRVPGLLAMLSLLLAACANQPHRYESPNRQNPRLATPGAASVNTAAPAPAAGVTSVPAVALDVGIDVFNPGLENLDPDQKITTPSVRRAEAHYMPKVLAETLSRRGVWGSVRVIPNKQTEMDLWVDGTILRSDGAELALQITATDATGRPWLNKKYEHTLERYAYDPDPTVAYRDPFQPLYERIADDIQRAASEQDAAALQEVRAVSQLQFAQRFAPTQFASYLEQGDDGRTRVQRLPALDDPALARIADLRARDLMFVDQIDTYVGEYAQTMQGSYDRWRQTSQVEVAQMKELKTSGLVRKIGGALAMLGGLAAMATSENSGMGAVGLAGMAGGAYLFGSGVEKSREAQIHEAALEELADSFGTSMKPHHIELADRSVTLAGSVDEQYAQWRALLQEIYLNENGDGALPAITSDPPPR